MTVTPYIPFQRFVCSCTSETQCSDEDISSMVKEYYDIQEDIKLGNISNYNGPTVAELQEIIERAENYTDNWYHSEVTFTTKEEDDPDLVLRKKVEELGAEHGISILYVLPGLEADNLGADNENEPPERIVLTA